MQKGQVPSNTENMESTELMSEMALASNQFFEQKQFFQKEMEQKDRKYLIAVQSHNRELIAKIRQLDKRLNSELQSLNKKILSPAKRRPSVPKLEVFQSDQLRNKFQEMQKLKKQLDSKRIGMDSLQFLLSVRQKYNLRLSYLISQIKQKTQSLNKLKKMHSKIVDSDSRRRREVINIGQYDIFGNEIEELKQKVREKNEKIKKKKEQFLSLYHNNKSKSSRSFVVQQMGTDKVQEQKDEELINLKRQYEVIGNRVAALKVKKANLLKNNSENIQSIKMLQKLKQKYQNLKKILAK